LAHPLQEVEKMIEHKPAVRSSDAQFPGSLTQTEQGG